MTLSDTQLTVLAAAARRPNLIALPLPERLKGGAAHKVVDALLAKGLLAEIPAGGAPVWREGANGAVTLAATAAALDALGIETEDALPDEDAPEAEQPEAPEAETASDAEAAPAPAAMTIDEAFEHAARETAAANDAPSPRAVATRDGTKQAALIALLRRPEGATLAEMTEATNWQVHYADARIMPM